MVCKQYLTLLDASLIGQAHQIRMVVHGRVHNNFGRQF